MQKRTPLLFSLLSAAVLMGAAGCGGSAGGVTQTGRSINASTDGIWGLAVAYESGNDTVKVGGKKIVIAARNIQVDGKPAANIPVATKRVDVQHAKGMITILADGQKVYVTR